jgi:hypothetical protein
MASLSILSYEGWRTRERGEVIMQVQNGALLAVVLLWLSVGLFDHAEAKTVEAGDATASWTRKGVIEDIGGRGQRL